MADAGAAAFRAGGAAPSAGAALLGRPSTVLCSSIAAAAAGCAGAHSWQRLQANVPVVCEPACGRPCTVGCWRGPASSSAGACCRPTSPFRASRSYALCRRPGRLTAHSSAAALEAAPEAAQHGCAWGACEQPLCRPAGGGNSTRCTACPSRRQQPVCHTGAWSGSGRAQPIGPLCRPGLAAAPTPAAVVGGGACSSSARGRGRCGRPSRLVSWPRASRPLLWCRRVRGDDSSGRRRQQHDAAPPATTRRRSRFSCRTAGVPILCLDARPGAAAAADGSANAAAAASVLLASGAGRRPAPAATGCRRRHRRPGCFNQQRCIPTPASRPRCRSVQRSRAHNEARGCSRRYWRHPHHCPRPRRPAGAKQRLHGACSTANSAGIRSCPWSATATASLR